MIASILYNKGSAPDYVPDYELDNVPGNTQLTADLNLDVVFNAMAEGDPFIASAAQSIMLKTHGPSAEIITNRQNALSDAIQNPDIIKALYNITSARLAEYNEYYNMNKPAFSRFTPVTTRLRDTAVLCRILLDCMEAVADIAEKNSAKFVSPGFKTLFASMNFYDKAFIRDAKNQLDGLTKITEAANISYNARIGPGMKGTGYVLREINNAISKKKKRPGACIPLTNVKLQAEALSLMGAGLTKLLRILSEINEHTLRDVKQLQFEMGFCLGCYNLAKKLDMIGQPVCFPKPASHLAFDELVDIGLTLQNVARPVHNSMDGRGKTLIIITGANQGGKSTFLRAVGCAQVMARCGMFVTAKSYAPVSGQVFTHFCRGESGSGSGRLDEELFRLNGIVKQIEPGSMLLLNESFSSTSEREGSLIAREIISALYNKRVQTFFVTHLYDFAKSVYDEGLPGVEFLLAQRSDDGSRSFRLTAGEPGRTSYGLDLYYEMMGIEVIL